mgnify:CR=1 FL=1
MNNLLCKVWRYPVTIALELLREETLEALEPEYLDSEAQLFADRFPQCGERR